MTRIFLDSSVLFSAAYSSSGHSRDLLLMAARKEITIIVSRYVLDETRRNLDKIVPELVPFLDLVVDNISLDYVSPTKREVLKAAEHVVLKDAPIVAAAKKADKRMLVSLDKKHILGKPEIAEYVGADIVTPKEAITTLQSLE